MFADRPILEIRRREPGGGDARARRDAERREDQPLRHRRPRRAARRATTTPAIVRAALSAAGHRRRRHRAGRAVARGRVPRRGRSRRAGAPHEEGAGGRPQGAAADPRATGGRCSILLFVPAFFLLLYGYALNFDIRHVALAVEDRDRTPESRAARRRRSSTRATSIWSRPSIRRARSTRLIDRGRGARGARHSRGLRARPARRRRSRRAGDHQRRQREHRDHGDGLRARRSLRERVGAVRPPATARRLPLVRVEPRVWYNPELRSTLFLVPGLIAYIAMITAVVSTALSIVREKETRHDGAGAHGADSTPARSSSARRCRIS